MATTPRGGVAHKQKRASFSAIFYPIQYSSDRWVHVMNGRIVAAGVFGLVGVVAIGAGLVYLLTPDPTPVAIEAPSPLLIARTEDQPTSNVPAIVNADPLGMPSTYTRPSPPRLPGGRAVAPSAGGRPPPPSLVPAPGSVRSRGPVEGSVPDSSAAPPPAASQDPAPAAATAPPPADHQAPVAKPPHVADHRYDGALTVPEIARLKSALRLSRDQEAFWPPVANLLRELGRQQMAQIDAGHRPDNSMSSDMMQRFYSAASPLLQSLREDQKSEVRRRAKMMGLEAYASYI